MRKILMITQNDMSQDDGDTIRVKKIAHLLEGFDIEYFGLGVSTKKYLLPIKLMIMVYKIAKTDWDYIYVNNQRYVVIIASLVKRYQSKVIYDTLMTWKLQGGKKNRALEEKLAGNSADYVLAVSELTKEYFKGSLLVPTLVDTEKFKMNLVVRKQIRESYGIKDSDIVVGLIGSFESEYNKPSLEYLYGNLDKFDKRIKFMLIGEVNERMGGLIYTGYVQDYVGTLSALDALLVYRTIRTDGAINRMVEVMSMGIPVFANLTASQSMDYARHSDDYYVCYDGALARAINLFMTTEDKGTIVGLNGKKVIEKYYAENQYKDKLLGLLR